MLPQNYLVNRRSRSKDDDDDEDDDEQTQRPNVTRGARLAAAAPPLGVTGVLCESHSLPIHNRGTLQYTVFRPKYVHMKPPLVCLAGGPYLPWNYLSTLVHLINDRSLIFMDPIGCGPSKRTQQQQQQQQAGNPIPDMVHDLVQLMQHLHLQHYHLYGHSFGGIVAYEALVVAGNKMPGTCLSLILSSTPANVPQALQDINQLKEKLLLASSSRAAHNDSSGQDDNDLQHAVAQQFAEQHECRVRPLPGPLQQSFAMAGFFSSPAGWQLVADYHVQPPIDNNNKLAMPMLLLRGEFDFITQECMDPWWDCVVGTETTSSSSSPDRSVTTLPGVAHYGMLEDEEGYGAALRAFLAQVPEPALQIPTTTRQTMPSVPSRSHLPR